MRHDGNQRQTTGIFRGPERWRLVTGILMLAVLAMLISRAGDPNGWRWLAATKRVAPPAPARKIPRPTGPTDEDRNEADAARKEFQAITNGTTNLGPEEMPAYNRLVAWASNQSFARLWQRARKDVWYTDLYDAPAKHRGELIALDIEIGRAQSVGKNDDGAALYEVWGATDESRGRLYDLIVAGYPKDLPVGYDIRRQSGKIEARFAGYFLKLQGYEAASARPGRRPEKAPLLIGRIEWTPAPGPLVDNTREWVWSAVLLAIVAAVLGFRFIFLRRKRPKPTLRPMVTASSGDVIPVEVWLERANLGEEDNKDKDAGQ